MPEGRNRSKCEKCLETEDSRWILRKEKIFLRRYLSRNNSLKTCIPSTNINNMQASELFNAHLKFIATDAQKWRDLFDENAVMEFPYAPTIGAPEKYEGINAIFDHVQTAVMAQIKDANFSNIRIQSINEENSVGEFELIATVKSSGKIYNQKYIALVTSKNGKIIHMKEYWNPVQVTKSFDALPGL